jgi:hypothetical protein
LIDDETIDILHDGSAVLFARAIGQNKYKLLFGTNDKKLIEILTRSRTAQDKQKACVWKEATIIHYLWKIIDAVWTQVWVETTQAIEECSTDYSSDTGSGTTHHEQGGSSEFDLAIS